MKKISTISILLPLLLNATPYLSNKSCKECHPKIYDEYMHSWHSKGYFNDELHRAVADKVPVYDCAKCHTPSSTNQEDLASGKAKLKKIYQEDRDAISCFYCHQIAYVKEAHNSNNIILAKQAEGYKPSLFGSLENPDSSDKHSMVHSPIYKKYACIGCHSYKRNKNGLMIFQATKPGEGSEDCIKCHMPYEPGGVEKMNRRGRSEHRSHYFRGVHDAKMREKAVDIKINPSDDRLKITLTNKMGHPLIIQSARQMYLKTQIIRDGKVIWSSFQKSPSEDKKALFMVDYLLEDGTLAPIPYFATKNGYTHNLGAKESIDLEYKIPKLKKGDKIVSEMFVVLAKPSCLKVIGLDKKRWSKPLLMKRVEFIVE